MINCTQMKFVAIMLVPLVLGSLYQNCTVLLQKVPHETKNTNILKRMMFKRWCSCVILDFCLRLRKVFFEGFDRIRGIFSWVCKFSWSSSTVSYCLDISFGYRFLNIPFAYRVGINLQLEDLLALEVSIISSPWKYFIFIILVTLWLWGDIRTFQLLRSSSSYFLVFYWVNYVQLHQFKFFVNLKLRNPT